MSYNVQEERMAESALDEYETDIGQQQEDDLAGSATDAGSSAEGQLEAGPFQDCEERPESLEDGVAADETAQPAAPVPGDGEEQAQPEEKPKRKRATRKRTAEAAAEEHVGNTQQGEDQENGNEQQSNPPDYAFPGNDEVSDGDVPPEIEAEGADTETDAFVLEESEETGADDTALDGEGTDRPKQEAESGPVEGSEPVNKSKPRRGRRTAAADRGPKEQFASRPLKNKPALLSLDLNELDKNLTEEEREEWNAIYASYRSKSLLTGRVMGIDTHSFTVRSRETGQVERRKMQCAVIISHRVKVLIPETEVWVPGQERPSYVMRNMTGAEIDYTILDVDREGGVAIGSRRMAMMARRHFFDSVKSGHEVGEKLSCRVLSVGPKRCLVECGGRDMSLSQKDLTYTATPDLRERYHPGQTLDCILKEYNRQTGQMWVSVKETVANPFFGAIKRHPVGSRRQAVISGKYGGGVFCTLPDETVCLCLYSTRHSDSDFRVGDTVILAIKQFDYERSLIYGRILSKW